MADGSRKPVVIRRYADLTPEERDIESGRIAHLHTSDGLYISARVKLKITMPETMTVLRTASS